MMRRFFSAAVSLAAAVVLLAEEGWAREHHWPVLARVVDAQVGATKRDQIK